MKFLDYVGKIVTLHLDGGEKFSAKLVATDYTNGGWLVLDSGEDSDKLICIRMSAVQVFIV
jgi:hypothetical protein